MSVQIANVNPAINSFQNWLDKTNQGLYVISTQALTAELTTAGSVTTGNAVLQGVFTSNTVTIANTLRGGTMTTSGNLNISTNTIIRDASVFYFNNTNINAVNSNTYVNSSVMYITGGSANISSNVSFSGNTISITSNNITIADTTSKFQVSSANVIVQGTNTSISSNVTVGGTNTVFDSNVFFNGTVNFDGGLTVVGTSELRGDVVIGNTVANTVAIKASVNTSIIPDQDNRRDLGSETKQWANLYVVNIKATGIDYQGDLASVNAISTNTISVGTLTELRSFSNDNIGNANTAGVFTPVPIFTIEKTVARSLKLVVQMRNTTINTWSTSEMLLVHDGTTPFVTTYATLSTNTTANAYVYTADISGSNVRVLVAQPTGAPNSAVVGTIQFIKV